MSELSSYEQKALDEIEREKDRRIKQAPARLVPNRAKGVAKKSGTWARGLPGAERALIATSTGYARAAEGLGKAMSRSSQLTLSDRRVLRAYSQGGHTLNSLSEIQKLDLREVDAIAKFKRLNHLYAASVAIEGAASGAVISGGELIATAGGVAGVGAGAAPGLGVVASAVAADAAAVLLAASRVVAHTALYYGYDPEDPKEEVFMMSVISLGTAATQSAKMASYAELSRLTQMLARSAPWVKLNSSVLTKISQKFAVEFGQNLTKKKLGQFVPVAGILVGAGLNYAMVDRIADAAYWSYRERFLRDKLGGVMTIPETESSIDPSDTDGEVEEPFDVLGLLEGEGIEIRRSPDGSAENE